MSVDYQAVTARDLSLLENDKAGTAFDVRELVAKIQAAIPDFEVGAVGEHCELDWCDEDEGGYIQAYITPFSVGVAHGFQGSDAMMDTLMQLFEVLQEQGLHVFDPQAGDWLGG